jgi:hypothetical protein
MANAVYILCALTSLACAVLLTRGYRLSKARMLLWSSVCFLGLAANNLLLVLDNIVFPSVDMYLFRLAVAAVSLAIIVFGLIWDVER